MAPKSLVVSLRKSTFVASNAYFIAFQLVVNGKGGKKKRTEVQALHSISPVFQRNIFTFELPADPVDSIRLQVGAFTLSGGDADEASGKLSGVLFASTVLDLQQHLPDLNSLSAAAKASSDGTTLSLKLRRPVKQGGQADVPMSPEGPRGSPMSPTFSFVRNAGSSPVRGLTPAPGFSPRADDSLLGTVTLHLQVMAADRDSEALAEYPGRLNVAPLPELRLRPERLISACDTRRAERVLIDLVNAGGLMIDPELLFEVNSTYNVPSRAWPWRAIQHLAPSLIAQSLEQYPRKSAELGSPIAEGSAADPIHLYQQLVIFRVNISSLRIETGASTSELNRTFRVLAALQPTFSLDEKPGGFELDCTTSSGTVNREGALCWNEQLLVMLPVGRCKRDVFLHFLALEEVCIPGDAGSPVRCEAFGVVHRACMRVTDVAAGTVMPTCFQMRDDTASSLSCTVECIANPLVQPSANDTLSPRATSAPIAVTPSHSFLNFASQEPGSFVSDVSCGILTVFIPHIDITGDADALPSASAPPPQQRRVRRQSLSETETWLLAGQRKSTALQDIVQQDSTHFSRGNVRLVVRLASVVEGIPQVGAVACVSSDKASCVDASAVVNLLDSGTWCSTRLASCSAPCMGVDDMELAGGKRKTRMYFGTGVRMRISTHGISELLLSACRDTAGKRRICLQILVIEDTSMPPTAIGEALSVVPQGRLLGHLNIPIEEVFNSSRGTTPSSGSALLETITCSTAIDKIDSLHSGPAQAATDMSISVLSLPTAAAAYSFHRQSFQERPSASARSTVACESLEVRWLPLSPTRIPLDASWDDPGTVLGMVHFGNPSVLPQALGPSVRSSVTRAVCSIVRNVLVDASAMPPEEAVALLAAEEQNRAFSELICSHVSSAWLAVLRQVKSPKIADVGSAPIKVPDEAGAGTRAQRRSAHSVGPSLVVDEETIPSAPQSPLLLQQLRTALAVCGEEIRSLRSRVADSERSLVETLSAMWEREEEKAQQDEAIIQHTLMHSFSGVASTSPELCDAATAEALRRLAGYLAASQRDAGEVDDMRTLSLSVPESAILPLYRNTMRKCIALAREVHILRRKLAQMPPVPETQSQLPVEARHFLPAPAAPGATAPAATALTMLTQKTISCAHDALPEAFSSLHTPLPGPLQSLSGLTLPDAEARHCVTADVHFRLLKDFINLHCFAWDATHRLAELQSQLGSAVQKGSEASVYLLNVQTKLGKLYMLEELVKRQQAAIASSRAHRATSLRDISDIMRQLAAQAREYAAAVGSKSKKSSRHEAAFAHRVSSMMASEIISRDDEIRDLKQQLSALAATAASSKLGVESELSPSLRESSFLPPITTERERTRAAPRAEAERLPATIYSLLEEVRTDAMGEPTATRIRRESSTGRGVDDILNLIQRVTSE